VYDTVVVFDDGDYNGNDVSVAVAAMILFYIWIAISWHYRFNEFSSVEWLNLDIKNHFVSFTFIHNSNFLCEMNDEFIFNI
jgi:hypothetical protein